jgi:hypothetical protein
VSPYVFRLHPYSHVKTQQWNLVYVPYCTGDIYVGDSVQVYTGSRRRRAAARLAPQRRAQRVAVLAWLKNHLPRPTQMLTAGCSAGSIGALADYD